MGCGVGFGSVLGPVPTVRLRKENFTFAFAIAQWERAFKPSFKAVY